MTKIQESIIRTLCYSDVFEYPLTLEELHRYLISDKPVSESLVARSIEGLVIAGLLGNTDELFYLPGREKLVGKRKKRQEYSKQKMMIADEIVGLIGRIPTIRGVFLTGALAMGNAGEADDIDLMIVTRENTLWTTRVLVTLLLALKGVRRKPDSSEARDLVCTNLYLDETALKVPNNKQSLYTAHEVVQVRPLLNRRSVYGRFLAANSWVTEHMANFEILKLSEDTKETSSLMLGLVESILYRAQKLYMRRRITREVVTAHVAFFHPKNTGRWVLDRFEERCHKYLDC